MRRCIQLAKLGAGSVAPNPMVGAVFVNNDRIIGEGYHQRYGEAHAEVNCIRSVKQDDLALTSLSTLYVSLEPCVHYGKTPPCTELIIERKIPRVVIGCGDPFQEVNGKGIEKLRAAGIEVHTQILEQECKDLNKRFFTYHLHHRPYIILKWAQTANGKIANENQERLFISNELTNRLVHKWRSEESSILVGTNTALFDDPSLTTRFWPGSNPIRLVVDMDLRLPSTLKIFDGKQRTVVFNSIQHEESGNLIYYQLTKDVNLVHQLLNALNQLQVQSVLVEGGARLLQSFIDENLWDEIRVITNSSLYAGQGVPSPIIPEVAKIDEQKLLNDIVQTFIPVAGIVSPGGNRQSATRDKM